MSGQWRATALRVSLTAALLALLAPLAAGVPIAVAQGPDTIAGYAGRVTEARMLVDEALGNGDLDEAGAIALAESLEDLLPAGERVSAGTAVVAVDDSQFTGLVGRLASDPGGALAAGVPDDILLHLRSLERATGEPGRTVPQDRAALTRLVADRTAANRSSISSLFGDLVDRVGQAILDWWESVGASPATSRALSVITVVLLAGLTLLLVVVLIRAVVRARRETARAACAPGHPVVPGAVVPAAEGLPADPLAYADERAAAGDLRTALRALFGGAARSLQEAGLVRHTRTHTNGELLVAVRESGDVGLSGPLTALCSRFERAWYGHHDPGESGFASAREEYLAVGRAIAAARQGRDAA